MNRKTLLLVGLTGLMASIVRPAKATLKPSLPEEPRKTDPNVSMIVNRNPLPRGAFLWNDWAGPTPIKPSSFEEAEVMFRPSWSEGVKHLSDEDIGNPEFRGELRYVEVTMDGKPLHLPVVL